MNNPILAAARKPRPKEAIQPETAANAANEPLEATSATPQGQHGQVISKPMSVPLELHKMAASQRAELLIHRLGSLAVNIESERVYCYDQSKWCSFSDAELRREMVKIFKEHGAHYGDKMIAAAVATMKLGLPKMGEQSPNLIGFANGVYDIYARAFRPHQPHDWLLSHNGVNYDECADLEVTISKAAPSYHQWLTHSAGGDERQARRIEAALFMVLANRHDWQLFLEVTGEGGSGKSVFSRLAELLAGGERNAASGNMSELDSARERAQFVGKRLITLPDQPKFIGGGSGIKAITGGDSVAIDPKFEKPFSTVLQAVVLVTNNEPMVFTERNGGIARRRVIFPFNHVVPEAQRDSLLSRKIAAELPKIIRHLIEQFRNPEEAKDLLHEQRGSKGALAVKRETDPVVDFCGFLQFLDEPRGLMMGGNPTIKREPKRFLYHAYLAFMEYNGHPRPLAVNKFSQAMNAAAKEYQCNYLRRTIKGKAQTNAVLTNEADQFVFQSVHADE